MDDKFFFLHPTFYIKILVKFNPKKESKLDKFALEKNPISPQFFKLKNGEFYIEKQTLLWMLHIFRSKLSFTLFEV
jgi:hypothetical protein